MPQSIISQFSRQYNGPIETNRQVANIAARNAITSNRRWEGMLVYVVSEDTTYELKGGIDDTFWTPIAGLSDAPSDGEIYGRKDGNWELVDSGVSPVITEFEIEVPGLDSPETNILENSFRCTKIGTLVHIWGYIEISKDSTWTSGSSLLSFIGFPYIPDFNEFLPFSFMVDYLPDGGNRVARARFGEAGSDKNLTFSNLSPTTTLNNASINRNDWCSGSGQLSSKIIINVTFTTAS